MPPPHEDPNDSRLVLRELLVAFSDPGAVAPGFVAHVLADARELLHENMTEIPQRMPTLLFPRSAVVDIPDQPPVPPAAL